MTRTPFLSGLAAVALMSLFSTAQAATMYVHDNAGRLGTVDTDTGAVDVIGNFVLGGTGQTMTDIAFDPDGNLFGLSFDNLYSIDATTAELSLIGRHGIPGGNALVFGRDGTLYGASGNTTGLFSVDTMTGLGTFLGSTGFVSGGDLGFQGDDLFLASNSNQLVSIDLANPANSSAVGDFGVSNVFGIATDAAGTLYATAGITIFTVNTMTGAATDPVNYGGRGLNQAFGQAFFAEAGAPPMEMPTTAVPLPAGLPLLLTGLLGMGALARRRKAA